MQADAVYNFNGDDLIIVEWTNISREDRYANNQWLIPGNIYSQDMYDDYFVKRFADINGYALRDFATIKSVHHFLTNRCQFHFLAMCNLTTTFDEWVTEQSGTDKVFEKIKQMYQIHLDKILPSFYEILWDNNIENKLINSNDGHPNILEHYTYLTTVFNHQFQQKTINAVNTAHKKWIGVDRKIIESQEPWKMWQKANCFLRVSRNDIYNNVVIRKSESHTCRTNML